ncbi:hypothetical protein A4R44_03860 [Amycolatopsis sp. M39]|nr:hypothetical protein A4R44_03860 [Amycolatopsis sp. M39]
MRQSLSEQLGGEGTRKRRVRRLPAAVLWTGTAASVLALFATIIDQAGNQSLYGYTEAAYASHGVRPDPGLVYAILYAVAVTVIVLWGLMFLSSRARGWWAPVLSAVPAVVTATIALLLLTATEYGERVFSPVWGILVLLPAVLGVIATISLVRDARR